MLLICYTLNQGTAHSAAPRILSAAGRGGLKMSRRRYTSMQILASASLPCIWHSLLLLDTARQEGQRLEPRRKRWGRMCLLQFSSYAVGQVGRQHFPHPTPASLSGSGSSVGGEPLGSDCEVQHMVTKGVIDVQVVVMVGPH